MRFQQLKCDPNNVTKKKLIKSKKNWVVLTSLSIAGGLLLFSTPELTVNAASNDVKSTTQPATNTTPVSSQQVPASKTNSQATVATPVKTAVVPTTSTVVKPTIPSPDVQDTTPTTTPVKSTTDQTAAIKAQQPATAASPDISNKIDPRLKIPSLNPGSIIGNVVNSITGGNNKGPETTDSETSVDISHPQDPMADQTNLAKGISNTSHWYISSDKTLHFIDGELADNQNKKASPWAKDSDNITSASFDGKVKAAVHMNDMFSNLPRLDHIDHLDNVDFSQTTDISGMLSNDNSLKTIDLTKGNFSSVKTVHGLFENDTNLETANMKNTSFSNVNDYSNLFKNDTSLTDTDVSNWQMSSAHDLSSMFQNDIALKDITIGSWLMSSNVITGDSAKNKGMFDGTNFQSITLSSYNHFNEDTVLPSNLSNTWQELGKGGVKNPNGWKSFKTDQLGLIYPQADSTTNYVKTTFAPKPGTIRGILQVPTSIDGGKTIHNVEVKNVTGNVGDTIIVNAPVKNGYTPVKSTVTAKIIDKNTISVTDGTLNYIGNEVHDAVVTIPITLGNQSQTSTDITGHVGDTIKIPVSPKPGYNAKEKTIDVVINPDGTVTPKSSIHYDAKPSNSTSMIVTSNLGDITVSDLTGHKVGDIFTVFVPGKKGYNHGQGNNIDATVDTNGNIVMTSSDEKIKYIGDTISNLTLTVPVFINGKPSDDIVFTRPSAVVGKQVGFQVASRPNYDVNFSKIYATVTPDGKLKLIDPKTQINYTGTFENGFVSPQNNLNLPIKIAVSGHIGETIQAKVPNQDGYHISNSLINVEIGPNNSFKTNNNINYLLNDAPTQDVTVHTNKGDKIIKDVSGHHVKDSFDLKTPGEPGYSPDKKQVHATVDLNGNIQIADKVIYSPDTVSTTITLNTNMGPKTVNVSGTVDNTTKVSLPHIQGYTPNKDIISVGFGTDKKPIFDTHKIIYTGNAADAQNVIVPSNQTDQTVHIDNSHKVGDSFTVPTPPLTGYKPKDDRIHFTIDANGHAITNDTIDYQGDTVNGKVKINSNYPATIFQTVNGKVGDTVTVDVPQKGGYTTDKKQIQAIINPDHTITTKDVVKYTGNKIDGKVLVNATLNGHPTDKQEITVNQVQVGSTIRLTPNNIKGYHLKDKNFVINASVTPTGITTNDTIDYVGDPYNNTVTVDSNLGKQKLHVTGKVGDTVKVKVSSPNGYHLNNSTIDVTITPTGTSHIDDIYYLGDHLTNLTLKIPTYKNDKTAAITQIPISNADVGSEVTFTPNDIKGYTTDGKTVVGIVGPDGTITTNGEIHYHGKEVDNGKLTVNITLNGTKQKTETINIAKTNVGSTLKPKPNKIPGYHLDPNNPVLIATVDDSENINTADQLNYIGDSVESIIDVPSNLGVQHIKVSGKVGDKLAIPVTNPTGYHSDKKTIDVTIGSDKKPKTNDTLSFIGEPVDNATVKIASNQGDQTVTDISGRVGDTLDVLVPNIPGFTADKKTIKVIINPDNTVSALENIIYTQIPESTSQPTIEVNSQDVHVNTFDNQPKVPVYEEVDDNYMNVIPNDSVNPNTAFLSDEQIQINGVKYYRIGQNRYIKISQVYPFTPTQQEIKITGQAAAPLYTATGSLIALRHVIGGSIWKVDQIITINDTKYYRIGTDAFVSGNNAVLYQ